ncbi:hypothetical protein HII31_11884 [Pseudocercospora fuligena]|uniref:Uncharacterized protein n=1 Tax=Pseudocercospora fuligena TaxID=685502 RepID=A0A8H6RAC1_9PEZI|nr:hypothetical protein HII31_11884 [Pseudocercospora fuligena]
MHSHKQEYDFYWRLEDYFNLSGKDLKALLLKAGVKIKASASKDALITEKHRLDTGKLNYAACNEAELKKFVIDRLGAKEANGAKKSDLVAKLEAADEELEFKRFLDLPTELRDRIAVFYMGGFGRQNFVKHPTVSGQLQADYSERLRLIGLDHPTQPPLTRVNRQLRSELLPSFYKTCVFNMYFCYTYNATGPRSREVCRIHPDTKDWLQQVGGGNIKYLRNIRLSVMFANTMHTRYQDASTCFVYDLRIDAPKKRQALTSFEWGQWGRPESFYDAARARVEPALKQWVKEINIREGQAKVRFEDVEGLRQAVQSSFQDPWATGYSNVAYPQTKFEDSDEEDDE